MIGWIQALALDSQIGLFIVGSIEFLGSGSFRCLRTQDHYLMECPRQEDCCPTEASEEDLGVLADKAAPMDVGVLLPHGG